MIFVQSLRGLSHTKLEDTKREHLELSVQALDRLTSKTTAPGWHDARKARNLIRREPNQIALFDPSVAARSFSGVRAPSRPAASGRIRSPPSVTRSRCRRPGTTRGKTGRTSNVLQHVAVQPLRDALRCRRRVRRDEPVAERIRTVVEALARVHWLSAYWMFRAERRLRSGSRDVLERGSGSRGRSLPDPRSSALRTRRPLARGRTTSASGADQRLLERRRGAGGTGSRQPAACSRSCV